MKFIAGLLLGIFAGLVGSVPLRRSLIYYSEHSLPKPDYLGPKYYINGQPVTEQVFLEAIPDE